MEKRHFEALAQALYLFARPNMSLMDYNKLLEALADVCEQFNPRFKRDLWIAKATVGIYRAKETA